MKNVLMTANILLFVILLMAYTNKGEPAKRPTNTSVQLGIDPELSRQMLELYRERIWKTRNLGLARQDARSVWFSLDKLKAFIESIEQKVGGNCSKSYGLGIRIYYSVYPDSTVIKADKKQKKYFDDHKLPMEYANHHTVVMVPTYWNESDGYNYDFDPRFRKRGASCEFAPIQDLMPALFDNRLLRENPKFVFNDSGSITPKKTFMIMPDNTDTRRFMPEFLYGNKSALLNNRKSNRGGADVESEYFTESDFTNGGSLIPPPNPKTTPDGTSFMSMPGSNPPATDQSTSNSKVINGQANKKAPISKIDARMLRDFRIHVPASGASYMRWVDKTNDTGWVRPIRDVNSYQEQ
jgi:hypothetical protein